MSDYKHMETQAIHEGYTPDHTRSRAVPLYRNTSYVFHTTEQAAKLFSLEELGNIYTRLTNPTIQMLEKRVSVLEGGKDAVAFASGTAAIYNAILNICKHGDEFISATTIYGGTHTMFAGIIADSNITVKFVDPFHLDNFTHAITEKTKFIFIESFGNPTLSILDIEKIADIAHNHGIPLMVDATFSTPYVIKSIDYGADIVINSLTKWMGGHGNAIGGIVIDAGTFQWADNPRFPQLNEPEKSLNEIRWAHDMGAYNEIAYAMRMRQVTLRNGGACLSPDNAWCFLQGLESLGVRMEKHCANAEKVVQFLQDDSRIASVNYPGLKDDASYDLAKKYCHNNLYGGMVVMTLEGGRPAGEDFINNLQLFSHLANVGDTKSLAIHPASTTHGGLSPEEQDAAGVTPGLVRLSIGIEHIDEIIGDIRQALDGIRC